MCHFQSSIWHLLLLFIQYVVPPFWDRFSWCVASFVLMCGASFWSCISHFLYFAVRVFSVCVLLRISCSLSPFLFSFVIAYVFFRATSSSIRKFSSLFLCLFVIIIEVKTLVFSSLFPRALFNLTMINYCMYAIINQPSERGEIITSVYVLSARQLSSAALFS